MADLGLFQLFPIQVETDLAAQGLELIQLFSPDQFRCRLMDRIGLSLGGCDVHEFPNEFLVEIQCHTHRRIFLDSLESYGEGLHMSIVLAGNHAWAGDKQDRL